MTKKLEELLNLPDNKELVKQTEQEIKNKEKAEQAVVEQQDTVRDLAELDNFASALPAVNG